MVFFTALAAKAEPLSCGRDRLNVSREIAIDGAQQLSLGFQSYRTTLDLKDREVVLTFDDGPAAGTTAEILDALKQQCVKATFFLIGRNAAALPALVKREIEEGHTIGYHSMTHPEGTLRTMTFEAAKTDIDEGIAAVDAAAGSGMATKAPRSPFFRFPGFADSDALRDYVHARGMAVFGSDVWASDWREMTPQEELELILGRLEKAGKGIVLFHDIHPKTLVILPQFLQALSDRGYTVVQLVAKRPSIFDQPVITASLPAVAAAPPAAPGTAKP